MTARDAETENIERVRKGFEAFAASDIATLGDLFEANATWRAEPVGIMAGSYDGRDAIFAMFAQIARETGGTFRTVPTAMAASADKVFVQSTVTGDRHGRKLHADEAIVFTLADGRVRAVRLFHGDSAQAAAFWG